MSLDRLACSSEHDVSMNTPDGGLSDGCEFISEDPTARPLRSPTASRGGAILT